MNDDSQSRKGPAQLPTGRPSDKPSPTKIELHHNTSAAGQRQQALKTLPTGRIMNEFTRALAEVPADQRLAICEWVAARGLLGVAHEGGFEVAASLAYRYADTLAGGVR
jgi:hypothetical protein